MINLLKYIVYSKCDLVIWCLTRKRTKWQSHENCATHLKVEDEDRNKVCGFPKKWSYPAKSSSCRSVWCRVVSFISWWRKTQLHCGYRWQKKAVLEARTAADVESHDQREPRKRRPSRRMEQGQINQMKRKSRHIALKTDQETTCGNWVVTISWSEGNRKNINTLCNIRWKDIPRTKHSR